MCDHVLYSWYLLGQMGTGTTVEDCFINDQELRHCEGAAGKQYHQLMDPGGREALLTRCSENILTGLSGQIILIPIYWKAVYRYLPLVLLLMYEFHIPGYRKMEENRNMATDTPGN